MPISLIQQSPRGTSGAPSLTTQATFTDFQPTPGNWVVAIVNSGSAEYSTDISSWTATDNQTPPNVYTARAFVTAQGNAAAVFTAPITTSLGPFTVTTTAAPGTADPDQGLSLFEVSPLDAANLVDILVQLSNQTSFTSTFNVTTSVPTVADEIVFALVAVRGFGQLNAVPTPSVPPSGYTTAVKVDSGVGTAYIAYRILTAAAAQTINFTGVPQDGSPGMIVISFRGAAGTAPGTVAESIAFTDSQVSRLTSANTQAESIAFTDTQTAGVQTSNTVAESIAFADSQNGTVVAPGTSTVAETIAFADSQVSRLTSRNTVFESIGFIDSQSSNQPAFTGLIYGDLSFGRKAKKRSAVRIRKDELDEIRKELEAGFEAEEANELPEPLAHEQAESRALEPIEPIEPTPQTPARVETPEARRKRRQAQQRRLLLDED